MYNFIFTIPQNVLQIEPWVILKCATLAKNYFIEKLPHSLGDNTVMKNWLFNSIIVNIDCDLSDIEQH